MGTFEKPRITMLFIILAYVAIVKGADLRCYQGSFNNYTTYSLDNPNPFLNSASYQSTRKTVIFVAGLDDKMTELTTQTMVEAYLNKANICVLNWEKEASTGILGPASYLVTAIPNAIRIGIQLGKTLLRLHNAGLNLASVHLIGFSLGAQLVGYACREVKDNNNIVGRATGLDPAGPAYDGIISFRQLSASDASFVDLILGNPGALGTNEATGTVNIRPNCGSRVQPGCEAWGLGSIGLFSEQNRCSHDRVWRYFAESVERPTAFEARLATGCDDWRAGKGTNKTTYMGDGIDTDAIGNYYLVTEASSLYGKGAEGSQPTN